MSKAAARNMVWARARGVCSFPGCGQVCVDEHTRGRATSIGEIAHIVSSRPRGPRHNPDLPDYDVYANLLLLCRVHHKLVDDRPDLYTVENLFGWKRELDKRFTDDLARVALDVSFAELDVVTRNLANDQTPLTTSVSLIPIQAKMRRNSLTGTTGTLLDIGLLMVRRVENYLDNMEGLDAGFAARLTAGFVARYMELQQEGLSGDELFSELQVFSTQASFDVLHQNAGLAVLVYLFERCEVFERV